MIQPLNRSIQGNDLPQNSHIAIFSLSCRLRNKGLSNFYDACDF